MPELNRRAFLKQSAAATGSIALFATHAATSSEKFIVGVMGLGGRGSALTGMFAARQDVEIAYLCDPDSRRFASAQKIVADASGHSAEAVQDFRRILDDKRVD